MDTLPMLNAGPLPLQLNELQYSCYWPIPELGKPSDSKHIYHLSSERGTSRAELENKICRATCF